MPTPATKVATTRDVLGTIDDMLRAVKQADQPLSEPGSRGGASTHPSTKVDDHLQTATEGARSAENEADNKKDEPIGVDNTPEPTPGAKVQQESQLDVGITSKETGVDSAEVGTGSAKAGKDDPGSSHPARTDNDSLDGGKYASLRQSITGLKESGDQLIAAISVLAEQFQPKQAAAAPAAAPAAPAASPGDLTSASQAGADLAALLASPQDKQAADRIVMDASFQLCQEAEAAAVKVAEFLWAAEEAAQKEAAAKRADAGGGGDPNGQPPPPHHGHPHDGGGDDGGGDQQQLMQLLAGGQQMGGPDAMAGMAGGGAPGAGGPDPGAGPDGMDGGGVDPGTEGPPNQDEEIAMLEAIMQQLGITPEMLQAGAAAKAASLVATKTAGAVPRSTWQPKSASQKEAYNAAKKYFEELVGLVRPRSAA